MAQIMRFMILLAACVNSCDAVLRQRKPSTQRDAVDYSFERFVHDYGRSFKTGSLEYMSRAALFHTSLLEISAINARNGKWSAGVHEFMDWTEAEKQVLHGYKPSKKTHGLRSVGLAAIQTHSHLRSNATRKVWQASDAPASGGDLDTSNGPAQRSQGSCGSCWAIATVEAVEAQLRRNGMESLKLSEQALVDCTPNPQHCGGTGGCDGATGELGLAFIRDHGIPMSDEVTYTAETGTCEMAGQDGLFPAAAKRARVAGWNTMPSNKGSTQLMQALVEEGPAIVAVDANNWYAYHGGVFDGCDKDAELGHAVLLKGYGEDSGQKFWLIQNSWSHNWGENGHIRMLRHDDEDSWCGIDHKPSDGLGCDGGPPSVEVCGMCGILYDPIIPKGVSLEDGSGVSSSVNAFDSSLPAATPSLPSADISVANSMDSSSAGVADSVRKSLLGLDGNN